MKPVSEKQDVFENFLLCQNDEIMKIKRDCSSDVQYLGLKKLTRYLASIRKMSTFASQTKK